MKPLDYNKGMWDDDMDIHSGVGKVWHWINVEAAYSHYGPYNRWMDLQKIFGFYPRHFDEEQLLEDLFDLESRGKIEINLFEWRVRIDPELAEAEMKNRAAMAKVVENWERTGQSFTFGT